jgi:hypothetical protein
MPIAEPLMKKRNPLRSIALVCLLALSGATALAASSRQINQTEFLQRFLAPDSRPLVSYRAIRRLSASTRGGRMQATIEALTTLDAGSQFHYEIVSHEGSALIQRKVLIAALDAEQRALGGGDSHAAALTPDNYEFTSMINDQDDLVKVDLRPRRKHVMLIDGSMFLRNESAELVRLEGEPSRRPSFWTRRVHIVREYARIEGVHVPVAMRSTADVLIAGASTFSMTYRYTEINGRPVPAADNAGRDGGPASTPRR